MEEVEKECGWMYEIIYVDENGNFVKGIDGDVVKGKVNYIVWFDVFICLSCG